ncbi:putative rmlC-like jelly roll protein [Medicago truncatula]|uniref:Putative rmlC-like jelly roll protein n=1 Tax=Medicago truncatula TaxID=3880 RepID=A0A396IJU8_MEDTR|nr:putative rmlC-like jelly roll protein [Medicago truncatula]
MKIIYILFLFTIFSFNISHAPVHDFCVADLKAPNTNSGYSCKPDVNITSDDFVFHGFVARVFTNYIKLGITPATVTNFPALKGLRISTMAIDCDEGISPPMHTHPDATQGEITAGFLTPTSVYSKVLKLGDLFVIPKGMLHFATNSGKGKAKTYVFYSSENPRTHILDHLLFSNSLPSNLVAQTTFIDLDQVKKLKVCLVEVGRNIRIYFWLNCTFGPLCFKMLSFWPPN